MHLKWQWPPEAQGMIVVELNRGLLFKYPRAIIWCPVWCESQPRNITGTDGPDLRWPLTNEEDVDDIGTKYFNIKLFIVGRSLDTVFTRSKYIDTNLVISGIMMRTLFVRLN